jgi:cytochrome b pre-mRNA-processing protein 3
MKCSQKFIFGDTFDINKKNEFLGKYLTDYEDLIDIVKYFDDFHDNLSKKTLNYFIKSVINQ